MEIGPILRSLSRNKIRSFLLIAEIAVTLAIVLNCWNMISQQKDSMQRPSGIDEQNTIAVEAKAFGPEYQDREFRRQLVNRDVEDLAALPGVIGVTPISTWPLQGGGSSFQSKPLGAPDSDLVRSPIYQVSTGMVAALDLEVIAGRAFEETDLPVTAESQILNVLVTKDLADALFPDGNAVGQNVDTGNEEFPGVIVGVIDYMFTPYGGGPMETRICFFPGDGSYSGGMQYLVRTEPAAFDEVFAAVDGILLENEAQRVIETQSLMDIRGQGQLLSRFTVQVLTVIIGLLLFVTTLGIYGMTSFSVTQRTKQIGTRRALGASRLEILRYFLIESFMVTIAGTALGLVGAWGLDIMIASQMDSARLGPQVLLAGIFMLWCLGLVATIVPAIRASRLSPALATRTV